jgi:hypothetical protein
MLDPPPVLIYLRPAIIRGTDIVVDRYRRRRMLNLIIDSFVMFVVIVGITIRLPSTHATRSTVPPQGAQIAPLKHQDLGF